jgi:hypothetical protein
LVAIHFHSTQVLRLHIDNSDSKTSVKHAPKDLKTAHNGYQAALTVGLIAGAVAVTGVAVMFYLKRTNL